MKLIDLKLTGRRELDIDLNLIHPELLQVLQDTIIKLIIGKEIILKSFLPRSMELKL